MRKTPFQTAQQRVQPDAAGAARNLGATFQRRSLPFLFALTTAASSAADAGVGRLIMALLGPARTRQGRLYGVLNMEPSAILVPATCKP
jgi:hypothetical protein